MNFRDLINEKYGYSILTYANHDEIEELVDTATYANVKVYKTEKEAMKAIKKFKGNISHKPYIAEVDLDDNEYTGKYFIGTWKTTKDYRR